MVSPDDDTDEPLAPAGPLLYVMQAIGLTALLALLAVPLAEMMVVR